MSVYARFTYTVQRHLEGSILLKWVIWHVTFFFACRALDYTFCLLIVRYMLSDKIKKHGLFYMNVTKLMYFIDLGCHRRKTVQARTLHWRNRLPNKN